MTATITLNNQLKGIEINFTEKPTADILQTLKTLCFRWHNTKKIWYAKQTAEALKFAESLTSESITAEQNKTLSLYDRCQFTKGSTDISKYDYKFVGSNYTNLPVKETAVEIRKHVKIRFPECKFSITSDYNSIDFSLKSSPYNYNTDNNLNRDETRKQFPEIHSILDYCTNLLKSYNYDDSDLQSDYHNAHFYGNNAKIDYNYTQTEQNEIVKADIINFKNRTAEAERAEEERREAEYIEQEKQHEINRLKREEWQKQEVINEEIIINNAIIKDLTEQEQYILSSVKWADMNKNNTLDEYITECNSGKFTINDCKATREIHFTTVEAIDLFKNMLLSDFDFIGGTGGSYTDDPRINSMIDYDNMSKEERNDVKWNNYGIAVYLENALQFVIDAQGYNYSRYVGLTDNTTKQPITKPQELTAEQKADKETADNITDYSTEIISNLELTSDTWQIDNSYKLEFKTALKLHNIRLTKSIIQQIEIEELKTMLYYLLNEQDSVQNQFADANIKQGDKITVYSIGEMMGMVSNSKMTVDSFVNCKYAQYDDAIKLTGTPKGKRNQYYTHLYSSNCFIVIKGWEEIPESILWEVSTSAAGFTCRKTRYGSCDNKQIQDIKEYFMQNNIEILVDRSNY